MSGDQFTALLIRIKEDASLREKLQGAGDLDAAEALVNEAGFNVSKEDWLRYYQEKESTAAKSDFVTELSDDQLELVSAGRSGYVWRAIKSAWFGVHADYLD